jgi:hypothetical protein
VFIGALVFNTTSHLRDSTCCSWSQPVRLALHAMLRYAVPRSHVLCCVQVSYTRKAFGQTGDGHFSPIGGYHSARDLVLILDTVSDLCIG